MKKIKIKRPLESYNCPKCNKELISENKLQKSGIVIKSKLVFLNGNGEILCRCKECKTVVPLPLIFNKYQNNINQE